MIATRKQPGCIKTTLIMVGVSFGFIAAIIFVADVKCGYDIENWWAPFYPNAETIKVEHDLFRPRALGESYVYTASADAVETVKQFYRDTRIATLKAGKTRGIANAESAVHAMEDAIATARARFDAISQEIDVMKEELDEAILQELAAERAASLVWLGTLERRLTQGDASLVVLYSACGI